MKLTQLIFPEYGTAQPPRGVPPALQGDLQTSGGVFIQTLLNWVFYLGIFIAIVFVLYAGVSWITSGGDSIKIAHAKGRLTFALIGLVIVVSAFFIVRVIIGTILGADTSYFLNIR